MKTKAQKQEDLKKASELFDKSKTLIFTDFGKIAAEDLRELRRVVKEAGGKMAVVKKRLLNVLFKDKGVDYDARQFEGSVGTIFAEGAIDTIAGTVHKFFAGLGADQKARLESEKKILGGYDVAAKAAIDRETVVMVGKLPPREVLLGQLLGQMLAPVQAFLYILQQKSEQK
jgi:large subunit ribosomal protein L10